MPTYISLASWTDQGIRNVKEAPQRGDAFKKAVEAKAGYNPRELLLAMFDVLDDWFNHPDYKGCLFINASSEFPAKNDPVRLAAANHYTVAADAIKMMAQGAGIDEVEEFAEEWVILMEGAISNSQVTGNNGSALIAKRIAEQRLETYMAK